MSNSVNKHSDGKHLEINIETQTDMTKGQQKYRNNQQIRLERDNVANK